MVKYLMNKDHDLIVTSSTTIHRGETGISNIEFLIPNELDGGELPLIIRYTLPNGDSYEKEIEDKDTEAKEGYCKYTLPLTKDLTDISGNVEFDLRYENEDGTIEFRSSISYFKIEPNSAYYVRKE